VSGPALAHDRLRRRLARLDHPRDFHTRTSLELDEDPGEVAFDRFLTEHEALGDLAVGEPILNEPGDLALAVAERPDAGLRAGAPASAREVLAKRRRSRTACAA
jgi:hypothetical protein